MADPYLGEIKLFAGSYAPLYWAFCDGQQLSTAEYPALFSLLGNFYGGDGRSTFALPDMRGRLPMHFGVGPGLAPRPIGQRAGMESVRLEAAQMPAHNHPMVATLDAATSNSPMGQLPAKAIPALYQDGTGAETVTLIDGTVGETGGDEGHYNLMPYLCLNYIICVERGTYPPRP